MTCHGSRRPAPQPKTVVILQSEYEKVSEELHTLRKDCADKQKTVLSQNQRIGELEVRLGSTDGRAGPRGAMSDRTSEVNELDRELNNLSVDDIIGIACKLLHSMEDVQSLELKFEISSTANWLLLRAWQKDRVERRLQEWKDMGRRQGKRSDFSLDAEVTERLRARAAKEIRGGGPSPSTGVMRRDPKFPPLAAPTLKHNPFAEALSRVSKGAPELLVLKSDELQPVGEFELVVGLPDKEKHKVFEETVAEYDRIKDRMLKP